MATKQVGHKKRKREPGVDAESPAKRRKNAKIQMSIPGDKFGSKLHHSVREVRKAAKTARTREIQRLVRKIKETRPKPEQEQELAALEQQLADLKTVDCEMIACSMLLRRLSKDGSVQGSEPAVQSLERELKDAASWEAKHQSSSQSSSKILAENRLRSSKYLSGQISDIVTSLVAVLQPSGGREKQASTTDPVKDVDISGQEEEWSSGSVDEGDERPITHKTRRKKSPDEDSNLSESSDDEDDAEGDQDVEGDSDEVSERDLPQEQDESEAETPVEQSSFLPSLAVGYISGDSDASDIDEGKGRKKGKQGIDVEPRKNRRGQRARMAIWEKKYGKNANHLKKEQEQQKDRSMNSRYGSSKWTPSPWKGPNRTRPGQTSAAPQQRSGPLNPDYPRREVPKTDASVHPSWEAARKKKSQPMVLPPMGKKIVF